MRRMPGRGRSVDAGRQASLPRYVVIMAGGQSARFWPLSRRRRPKQFLSIDKHRSLLQEAAGRVRPLCSWRHIVVVTHANYVEEVRRQLPRVPRRQILAEPLGRNTAACTTLAAEWIAAHVGDALMVVVPADHAIPDAAALRHTLRAASDLAARENCLVTVGVRPSAPETGYGYLEVGPPIGRVHPRQFWVRRFHEKPRAPAARRYVSSGRFLWNAGMFVWKTSVFRAALAQCAPALRRALDGIWSGPEPAARVRRAYRRLPSVSVDTALMQPISRRRDAAARVAVVRANFDWLDVGSWAAMPAVWGRDKHGNAGAGRWLSIAARNSVVYAPERLVALVGVTDLIVVDTPDALLVCARDHAQDVRGVVAELERRRWSRYL